jgi:hypothetical protein
MTPADRQHTSAYAIHTHTNTHTHTHIDTHTQTHTPATSLPPAKVRAGGAAVHALASELPADAHVLPDIPSPATCALSVYQGVIIALRTERARRLMLSRRREVARCLLATPQSNNTDTFSPPFQGRKISRKARGGAWHHSPNHTLHALHLSRGVIHVRRDWGSGAMRQGLVPLPPKLRYALVSGAQDLGAHISIRQHTSACVSVCQHTSVAGAQDLGAWEAD